MVTKKKKIKVNYRLLQTSGGIEVVGSVPDTQVYQGDKKEHTPDYTLTPLTLFPRCNATDPSAVTTPGRVNAKLTNMKWHEVIGGVRTLITSTNNNYVITESGEDKGLILVRRNSVTSQPVTLEFYAEYLDPRTGQMFVYRFTRLVRSVDGTDAIPVLMIDSPSAFDWNPCRSPSQHVITAKLMVGEQDVTNQEKCRIFFYRVLSSGAHELINDGNGDNDFEIKAVTKNSLTIDLDMIGHEQTYVVKAAYSQEGEPGNVPDNGIAEVSTAIRRRMPHIDVDWEGVPSGVSDGTKVVFPRPVIRDNIGVLTSPQSLFNCKWLAKYPGESTYNQVATGYAPKIAFRDGMMLALSVEDRGPWCAVMSGDSYVFAGDSLVVARENG